MRKPDNRSPQFITAIVIGWTLLPQAGCVQNSGVSVLPKADQASFRSDCLRFMEDCAFSHEPSLRMQAIEAFAHVAPKEGVQRKAIPLNIENKYSGIVFASLMATGEMEASQFEQLVRTRAESQDKNVRIAAIFALYRLGDRSRINELGQFLPVGAVGQDGRAQRHLAARLRLAGAGDQAAHRGAHAVGADQHVAEDVLRIAVAIDGHRHPVLALGVVGHLR